MLHVMAGPMSWEGELVDLRDPQGRISRYFLCGEGDGRFLAYSMPVGVAQSGVSLGELLVADFFPAQMSVPIFSRRAMLALAAVVDGDIEFHECLVHCEDQQIPCYLGRILRLESLVDEARSEYRELSDGGRILSDARYRPDHSMDFHIARDAIHRARYLVTGKFVDASRRAGLNIDFFPVD